MAIKAAKRRNQIMEMLVLKGRVVIAGAANVLQVSTMTVRRDIEAMEADGLVLRTPGGCMLRAAFVAEAAFPDKEKQHREQKLAIAAAAVSRVSSGMRIYLDTGTTCLQIARRLPLDLEATIFTNNLRVALELHGRAGIRVFVYGGFLAGHSPDLVGDYTLAQMTRFRLDVAFVGGDALEVATGEFFGADMATALMAQTAQTMAEQVVAVIDSSKFGKRSFAVAGRLKAGMALITDRDAAPAARKALRRTGAEIVLARNPAPVQASGKAGQEGIGS